MVNICAIIITFNSGEVIDACLKNLLEIGVKPLVIDNNSSDNTLEIVKSLNVDFIKNEKNQGFGRANNIGAKNTNAEWLLFINPDLEIKKPAFDEFMKAIENYPNAGMYGPKIIEPDGRVFLQPRSLLSPEFLNKAKTINAIGDCAVPFLSGACMLIKCEIFNKIGGFDENIFLFYEDDDLCRKLMDKGLSLIYIHEAVVNHLRGGSSRKLKGHSQKVRYHLAWSKFYISKKYSVKYNPYPDLIKNGFKYLLALISFNEKRIERYGGSFYGMLAAINGKTALEKEGLEFNS